MIGRYLSVFVSDVRVVYFHLAGRIGKSRKLPYPYRSIVDSSEGVYGGRRVKWIVA